MHIGNRKAKRIDFRKPGFVILAPDAPWIECWMTDISASGVCLSVGALSIPEIFVLVLNPSGSVRRACRRMWHRGELVGAEFVTAEELRKGHASTASRGAMELAAK
jgi:hypothetical protein